MRAKKKSKDIEESTLNFDYELQDRPMIKVGTLFSGIGAFEEALKQLHLPHEIEFACDNGEIEIIPLESSEERKEYKELDKKGENHLYEEELARYQELKALISHRIEEIRSTCYAMSDNAERTKYVNELYKKYSPFKHHNYVRDSYVAN